MSFSTKRERTVCVLLPNKSQLDITVGLKSTGQDVFNQVAELLGVKDLHFFGLTLLRDNEHIFLDMEEKLVKYFFKDWRQESGKGSPRRAFPLLLCLKVQYYVENGRLICERKVRHLYYSDLRERVLRSECRQQEEVYFQLAGYALQAELGDCPPQREGTALSAYFEPKDYFPPWIVAKRGVNYLLCHGPKVHQELWGTSPRDAILCFIRDACQLEDVPVTFYRLQKDKKEEKGTVLLGLTLQGMQVYQEMNNVRQLLYDFPWSNVGRLTFLGQKFEIQPDGLPSARKLIYYTGSSFRSRHLLLHLSSSHQIYLSLQPALKHLRQLEDSKEKKQYRESYISDDLDMDPPGSENSPGLSRHSTGSSGIEADTRHHSIHTEVASVGESCKGGECLRSEPSHNSSGNSGSGTENESQTVSQEQDGEIKAAVGSPEVGDAHKMFQLADLLEGVSVDCAEFFGLSPGKNHSRGGACHENIISNDNTPKQSTPHVSAELHNHSQDDVQAPAPPRMEQSSPRFHCDVTPNPKSCVEQDHCPILHYKTEPTFFGRSSNNSISSDTLSDDQFLEFIF